MRHIWTDVHEVGDAVAALSLGVALEEFTHLEEEHHENSLRELCLSPRQEADGQGTNGSNRHEEMLVEGITMSDPLPGLMQCLVAY